MALNKVNYVDNQTVITAQNLNNIQDCVIALQKNPRNLLDNSDFTNPINQRGQTSYTGLGCYTIDRWLKEQKSTVSIASDGITIDNSNSDTYDCFIQKIELKLVNKLIGKTITIAMCKADGTIYCNSGVVVYDAPVALIYTDNCTLTLQLFSNDASWQGARLILDKGQKVTLKWIALYEGEYTAETLPEYQPKGYAAELAECQRYYRRSFNGEVKNINYVGTPIVIAPNATSLQTIIFDMPMRVAPTVTTYGYKNRQANSVSDWNADTDITNTKISYVSNHGFTVGSDTQVFTTNKAYCFHYEANADL